MTWPESTLHDDDCHGGDQRGERSEMGQVGVSGLMAGPCVPHSPPCVLLASVQRDADELRRLGGVCSIRLVCESVTTLGSDPHRSR
jgi:hypothetical protein